MCMYIAYIACSSYKILCELYMPMDLKNNLKHLLLVCGGGAHMHVYAVALL